mgnify:CR=1 FL=1
MDKSTEQGRGTIEITGIDNPQRKFIDVEPNPDSTLLHGSGAGIGNGNGDDHGNEDGDGDGDGIDISVSFSKSSIYFGRLYD